jgi:hypothetical protein
VNTETVAEALIVMVVETLASRMVVAMADGDGDGGQNRVSGCSSGNSG